MTRLPVGVVVGKQFKALQSSDLASLLDGGEQSKMDMFAFVPDVCAELVTHLVYSADSNFVVTLGS